MPFYEYECPSCRYYLEVLQKISDKPLKKCPSCGKSGFKRLMSAPVFRLKGSGWYETDFKSDKEGQRNLASAEPAESKAAEAKPAGDEKAGAKPEAGAAADKSKSESAASPTDAKSAKASTSAGRSLNAKRALKRAAPRAKPKSARGHKRAKRGR
jgi:putative FmdB family regulatory protein